jgi:hypothetical protein
MARDMTIFLSFNSKALILPYCLVALLLASPLALALDEIEPNDTPSTAQALGQPQGLTTIKGSIGSTGDIDFFQLGSINSAWGFTAVLDTSASTTDRDATLSVYDADGTTLLQQDRGGWEKGSVVTLQHFQGIGGTPIYIKVESSNPGDTISAYTLRIYVTPVSDTAEMEPNDTPETGTISAIGHLGTLANDTDTDCFRLSGEENDRLILALRADPENDGSSTDFVLSVYDGSGSLLASADNSGPGGNEYIDTTHLSRSIYSYCVTANTGAGSTATYLAGPIVNDRYYLPSFTQTPRWLNPGLGDTATPGDIMQFRLAFTNTSLLPIPPQLSIGVYSIPACLSFADSSNFDYVSSTSADKYFDNQLDAGNTYTVDFSLNVLSVCNDQMLQSSGLSYYDFGTARPIPYLVTANQCESAVLQIVGPDYSGSGATYYSSETAIETAPDAPLSKITIEFPHKLILEAPSIAIKDGDTFVVNRGAQLRIYGKTVTCP